MFVAYPCVSRVYASVTHATRTEMALKDAQYVADALKGKLEQQRVAEQVRDVLTVFVCAGCSCLSASFARAHRVRAIVRASSSHWRASTSRCAHCVCGCVPCDVRVTDVSGGARLTARRRAAARAGARVAVLRVCACVVRVCCMS
jgi:hypothetical protein